jgi:hypothetical protein
VFENLEPLKNCQSYGISLCLLHNFLSSASLFLPMWRTRGPGCRDREYFAQVVPGPLKRWCQECGAWHAVHHSEMWCQWRGGLFRKDVSFRVCLSECIYDVTDLGRALGMEQVLRPGGHRSVPLQGFGKTSPTAPRASSDSRKGRRRHGRSR